ncbi:MAG: hypothetical protein H6585_10195 [Flavobacteriales bacterium]|nr:hypothetical protein [Flavobacteriales bacterium]
MPEPTLDELVAASGQLDNEGLPGVNAKVQQKVNTYVQNLATSLGLNISQMSVQIQAFGSDCIVTVFNGDQLLQSVSYNSVIKLSMI